MKLLKTKLATVLMLGIVMFSVFSFSTTPIAAQETSSNTSVTTDDEKALASFARLLGKAFIAGFLAGSGLGFLGDPAQSASTGYPTDALD